MDEQQIGLIQKAQRGDTKAFEDLVRLHDRKVLQIAYGMLGNMQDAQDVYQETFMKVFTKISSFRFESEFSTWLNRIVMNMSINKLRQRKLKRWMSLDQKKDEQPYWDVQETSKESQDFNDSLYSNNMIQRIKQSLKQLSSQQRSVFVLKHMHGYKISEIAATLNCAEGTVKNQLFRATKKLRDILKPYYNNNITV